MTYRLTIMGSTEPMHIFLGQEIDRIQVVIGLVTRTLKDLLLAIDGIIIMNEVINKINYYYSFTLHCGSGQQCWSSKILFTNI